jgi:16S rRNA (cytidine1402-2'-O)-methyltransferase
MKPKLYLIPSGINNEDPLIQLPVEVVKIISELTYFIVEEERTARRFIKKVVPNANINLLQFGIFNEHTPEIEIENLLEPLKFQSAGILSEAGVPCVADPGGLLVKRAHQLNITVEPLIGPSSLLLTLMASGLNGQNFIFHGYLPVKQDERKKKLKIIERRSVEENQTQLFIEAPYRNNQIFEDMLSVCASSTLLCVACNLTLPDQFIKTQSIALWRKSEKKNLHKHPTVFALQG